MLIRGSHPISPSPCTQLVLTHISWPRIGVEGGRGWILSRLSDEVVTRMFEVLSPLRWAQQQFGQAALGDKRRTQRTVMYAAAAAQSPSQTIPQQCDGRWKRTKGAYRLFDADEVEFDSLQSPHRRLTREEAARRRVVLWINDTTTLSFGHHRGTQGLGPTSKGGSGMLLHSTMGVDVSGGVDESPFVLGLGHQQLWVRRQKKDRKKPESIKWPKGIQAIGTPPPGARWVQVGDSESDCWEALEACRDQSIGFALRACQNRQVIEGHQWTGGCTAPEDCPLLFDLLRQQPALGNKKLWVRRRGDRAARWVSLAVSALPVTLFAPRNWGDKPHRQDSPRPQPVACWALRVHEINTPAGQEPVEWVILTDEPVRDRAAALEVAFWYSCRWLIEEYHKCLKSGCQIEARQLQEADRLKALLGILSVVAVRLLQLKHQARTNPDLPAFKIIPIPHVQALAAQLKQPWRRMTTRDFWRETARLGGFLGRKSDGDPGWLTLWRGWQDLELLATGYQLARKER
jgi:hypothetical protein